MEQIKDRSDRVLSTSLPKVMIVATKGPPLAIADFDAVLSLWKSIKLRTLKEMIENL